MSVILCLLGLSFVISFTNCDWVEIPQFSSERIFSNSKVFVVTPNPMSILEHNSGAYSSSFTTDLPMTSEYNIIRKPIVYAEPKKSITKIPDAFIRKISSNKNIAKLSNKVLTLNNTTNVGNSFKINAKYGNNIAPIIYQEDNEYYADEYDDEYEDDTDIEDDEEYYKDEEYNENDEKIEESENGISYVGLLPYMKNIQSTLLRTSHTNTKNKMTLLGNLRDFILHTIRKRIANLFGLKERKRRSARIDYQYEKDDKSIEFPSNESSLLTIGFLTFAVFLIKMVLKLIHAIKAKDSNYMMVAVTTAATRRKRSIRNDIPTTQELKIIDVVDSFKYKYK